MYWKGNLRSVITKENHCGLFFWLVILLKYIFRVIASIEDTIYTLLFKSLGSLIGLSQMEKSNALYFEWSLMLSTCKTPSLQFRPTCSFVWSVCFVHGEQSTEVQPDWQLRGQKETKTPLSNRSVRTEESAVVGKRNCTFSIKLCADYNRGRLKHS